MEIKKGVVIISNNFHLPFSLMNNVRLANILTMKNSPYIPIND